MDLFKTTNLIMILNIVLTTLLFSFSYLNAQTVIRGSFENHENWNPKIYLAAVGHFDDFHSVNNRNYIDTTAIENDGRFLFDIGNLDCEGCLYRLELREKGSNGSSIIGTGNFENYILFDLNEFDTITVNADANQFAKTYQLSSNNNNWGINEIRKIRKPVLSFIESMVIDLKTNNYSNEEKDSLMQVRQSEVFAMMLQNNEVLKDTILKSDNIYFILNGLSFIDFDYNIDNDSLLYVHVLNRLKTLHPEHLYTKQLNEKVYKFQFELPKGSIAPDFTLKNVLEEPISLSEQKTNLLLIDFWASWCSPCRKENRNTVKPLYDRYKHLGFEVVSVSMDDKKSRWTKAIQKDKMSWINLSDLLGRNSPIYNLYKIEKLPTTYLIDGETKVILAKNLRGDDLIKYVSDYFTN